MKKWGYLLTINRRAVVATRFSSRVEAKMALEKRKAEARGRGHTVSNGVIDTAEAIKAMADELRKEIRDGSKSLDQTRREKLQAQLRGYAKHRRT